MAETKDRAERSGETRSTSTGDSGTPWRVSSGANSLKCNTSWDPVQNEKPRYPDQSGLLRRHSWCVPALYSEGLSFLPPMITTEHKLYCLFGWKHKWSASIPFSFIVKPSIVSMNASKMDPITASDAFLRLHSWARWWRPQTERKGAIKDHLWAFVNSKT